MKNILAIVHQPSKNTQLLAEACQQGFSEGLKLSDIGFNYEVLNPLNVDSAMLLASDGVLLLSTENFGYMAGLFKDLFERIYYDVLEEKQGLPYALCVRAGLDGTGACRSIESITSALCWSPIRPAMVLKGEWQDSFFEDVKELATFLSVGTAEGIF